MSSLFRTAGAVFALVGSHASLQAQTPALQPVGWTYPSGELTASGGHRRAVPVQPEHCPELVLPAVPAPAPAQPDAKAPAQPAQPAAEAPVTDAFAQAPDAGTEAPTSFAPSMFGDFLGIFGNLNGQLYPLAQQGPFKLTDTGSPIPGNRVSLDFQYFSQGLGSGGTTGQNTYAERLTLGLERAFFDNRFSIGARIPGFRLDTGSFVEEELGDINLIGKYAVLSECDRVVSLGLSVILPTGPEILTNGPTGLTAFHPVLFQPFVGWYRANDRLFTQGFASVLAAADPRFPKYAFLDVGVGYWLYRAERDVCRTQILTGIVPCLEAHTNFGIANVGIDQLSGGGLPNVSASPTVSVEMEAVITAGVTYEFFRKLNVGLGAGVPITGPTPFDFELLANITFKY